MGNDGGSIPDRTSQIRVRKRKKRILMKRLKCPPALAQFFDPLDKDTTKKVYKILNYM